MNYHVARNSQQLGTFAKEDLVQRYNTGAILSTDLVWTEGMTTWEPASKVFGAPVAPAGGGVDAPTAPPPVVTGVATPMMTTPGGMPPDVQPKPNNNLIGAVLVTVFCCWPLGIPAIVFAAQVDGKHARGDYAGAEDSAKKAKMFIWISLGLGVVAGIIALMVGIAGAASSAGGY